MTAEPLEIEVGDRIGSVSGLLLRPADAWLLYVLARTRSAKLVVEFGTSFGISGIHLAAAVRDAGGGRLIATELDPIKAERAAHNFRAAGLSEVIDLRVGDAFETLKSGLGETVAHRS